MKQKLLFGWENEVFKQRKMDLGFLKKETEDERFLVEWNLLALNLLTDYADMTLGTLI